ncbi:phosphatase [Aureococcus anophagefferens]|nr:phosphatase [Aureococcus anophagefferens]
MVSGGAVHPYNGLGERPTVRVPRRSGEYGQYASGERTPGGGARTPGSGKAIVVAPADGLDSRQRARKRFRKVRTMVVASQAFSDAGRQRRERREGSRDITAPPVVDDDLELRAPRMFAAPDDIRKRTIVQHIVLGCRGAMDLKGQELGVTHVLNACSQLPNYHPDHFVYHKIAILDAPKAPIVTCAEVAAQFLQRVERVGGRCLVHCIAGSSRSVTLTLMHLMISHRVPLHVGFHHVNRMRPQANPNEGFKLQLALLEVKVLGGSSVAAKDAGTQWAFYEWNVRKATVPQIKDRCGKGQHARGGNAESSSCVLS